MSLNILKKTIVFSSAEGKQLIDSLLADSSAANGRTLSASLEYHLLYEPLLPQNQNAATWIIHMHQAQTSVGYVIADCMSYLAAIDSNRNADAFRAILQYCKLWGGDTEAHFTDQYSVSYLSTQVNSVIEDMKKIAETTTDIYLETDLFREANRMQCVIDDAVKKVSTAETGVEIDALYFFEVLAAYPVLGHCERAYRLVSWLAKHCQWRDTAKSRYAVIQLLKNVSRDWT